MIKRRGRPVGYRLSEASKRAISDSKKGQCHSQETKDKISRTLMLYFRRLKPLSEEIINKYCRCDDDDVCGWINSIREELDNLDDVMTDRSIRNAGKTEIAYGHNIEYFSHSITPELLLLAKEEAERLGVDLDELLDY